MMEPSELLAKLKQAFPDGDVTVEDLTGTKDHFRAEIVASAFAGRTPLQQHQMVYAALGDSVGGPIHALSLKTRTP